MCRPEECREIGQHEFDPRGIGDVRNNIGFEEVTVDPMAEPAPIVGMVRPAKDTCQSARQAGGSSRVGVPWGRFLTIRCVITIPIWHVWLSVLCGILPVVGAHSQNVVPPCESTLCRVRFVWNSSTYATLIARPSIFAREPQIAPGGVRAILCQAWEQAAAAVGLWRACRGWTGHHSPIQAATFLQPTRTLPKGFDRAVAPDTEWIPGSHSSGVQPALGGLAPSQVVPAVSITQAGTRILK